MSSSSMSMSRTVIVASTVAVGVAFWLQQKRKNNKTVPVVLPDWLVAYESSLKDKEFPTDEDMMKVAVEVSARNVEMKTGGPFGTAIFQRSKDGRTKLISLGCNRVVPCNNSTLHGETVAIMFAEQKLQTYSLHATEDAEYILCTSCEPCCMCLGSTLWSGVSELMCSATKDDAEAIGFNEGPVFPESYKALEEAGIKVKKRVLHKEGAAVLKRYGDTGVIY